MYRTPSGAGHNVDSSSSSAAAAAALAAAARTQAAAVAAALTACRNLLSAAWSAFQTMLRRSAGLPAVGVQAQPASVRGDHLAGPY